MATTNESKPPVFVTVSALDAGHLTLPERLFVTDADPDKVTTVPSLSFLIQHPSPPPSGRPGATTNLVFDLGLKRDLTGYPPAQQAHIATRQPLLLDPDCATSLRHGGLADPATTVDLIVLSHVHWDHVGTPADFPAATFAVGAGTLALLRRGAGPLYPAAIFNADELPRARTVEFPPVPDPGQRYAGPARGHVPPHTPSPADSVARPPGAAEGWAWGPLRGFPHALDFFGDGSVFVVDAPGHLYGHVNLLARLGPARYVYLGGDCCHDPRILSGERDIAMYPDGRGGMRSVHVHTEDARTVLDRIGEFVAGMKGGEAEEEEEGATVEVVVAHDGVWREANRAKFWPGKF